MSSQQTPLSLADDKENMMAIGHARLDHKKGLLTEPSKHRKPLQVRNDNKQTTPTGESKPILPKRCHSEPIPNKQQKHGIQNLAKERPARDSKKAKVRPYRWAYSDDSDGVDAICSILAVERPPSASTPVELFQCLESGGALSPAALRLYSICPQITTVNMTPSYGCTINEIGMCGHSRFSPQKCTVPFFGGFVGLNVLDLARVDIADDELRYLIKLTKLQALGLSGTAITSKGIKYLAKHAAFTESLECLKLCYLDQIDDKMLPELKSFQSLKELDLLGSNKITLGGFDRLDPFGLDRIRLPEKPAKHLAGLQKAFSELARKSPATTPDLDPSRVAKMSEDEARHQLRYFQKIYPDIFLNLSVDSLKDKLSKALTRRRKECHLYRINFS